MRAACASSAAQFVDEAGTAAGPPQPTSSVLILSSDDQSMPLFSFHGQLEMTQSVGSSHAARDPYFCTIVNAFVDAYGMSL